MSTVAAFNSKKSSSSSSFSSLPDEVVLNCLFRVPRWYDLNLSLVSKALRSLVRSPELYRLRSPHKSVYLSYDFYQGGLRRPLSYWITFRPGEKITDYQLAQRSLSLADVIPRPTLGSAVSVGSEIYFIGGSSVPSTMLWILDTRSGHLRTAPSMKVGRSSAYKVAVGVVDGKICVIGGSDEDSQVEMFDPETQTWDFAGEEKVKCNSKFSATLKEKVYMVDWDGRVSAYSRREGLNDEATELLTVSDSVKFLCVVENVLYACFRWGGLMWFNTNLKVWTRVVDPDGKLEQYSFAAAKMEEYEGMVALFWSLRNIDPINLMCKLIALNRVGDEIHGRIEWSGIVATLPSKILLKDCLVFSC